jgi:branched-chain amino acid transport system ATP-binding protein
LLQVEEVHAGYGAIRALRGVDLHVRHGEIVALIGANGGGKTTLVSVITGLLRPSRGRVSLGGRDVTQLAAHAIARLGIAMVPEGRGIFASLTVGENLEMGAYRRSDRATVDTDRSRVFEQFPILKERQHQLAGTLSGGQQQMLAIARSIMSQPALLILDEPSLGLAPLVVREVMQTVQRLRETGMTILLAEQNARLALRSADRAYVLETGRVVVHGPASDLLASAFVKDAYLGAAPV